VVRIYSKDVKYMLTESCTKLRTALSVSKDKAVDTKFATFVGSFGKIENFHQSIYEDIGSPNPDWEAAMRLDNVLNTDVFNTNNYHIETFPAAEWSYVVDGVIPPAASIGQNRVIKPLGEYMELDQCKEAGLTRVEVIALVLYTGPMFIVWNTVLS
jgi:hypothetical protein